MFFHNYPYTDAHELNLDWILKKIIEMQAEIKDFVVTNTVKYADPFQWNITRQYEKNTIVIEPLSGTAYLSTKPVPAGVNISNTDYWTPVFDLSQLFNAFNQNLTLHDEADNVVSFGAYSVGDWLIWRNELYRVDSAINIGDALAAADITRVTVEDYIKSLQADVTQLISDVSDAQGDITNLQNDMTAAQNDIITLQNDMTNAQNDITTLQNDVASLAVGNAAEMTSRPKLCWYSGNQSQVIGCKGFNMKGFRYAGQYMKAPTKYRTIENSYVFGGGFLAGKGDFDVIDSFEQETWYGFFVEATSDTECKPVVIPIMRISANSGNSFTVQKTQEGTSSAAFTASIGNVVGRDVLLITENGNISARVTQITSNTGNSLEFADKGYLAIGDYILIAPEGEYEYIASHYVDTGDWRNRGDNGFLVKSYGISDPTVFTTDTLNSSDLMNTISPMATGVFVQLSGTDGTSNTGTMYFQAGADGPHIDSFAMFQKGIATSTGVTSGVTPINFDYARSIYHKIVVGYSFNYKVRAQGYFEP